VLLGLLLANSSGTFPSIAGIILNGPFPLPPAVQDLMVGLDSPLPIIQTDLDTYDTAVRVMSTRPPRRLAAPLRHGAGPVRAARRHRRVHACPRPRPPTVVTPLMFEYQLWSARAPPQAHRAARGGDDRVLKAAATVLARGIADLTILGEEAEVRGRAVELGLDLSAAQVLSPFDPQIVHRFAEEYARLRAHKGVTYEKAADTVTDVSYFGT
jgi:phosphate acetyltransferase